MDNELEEELKERESTVAEFHRVENQVKDLQEEAARKNLEKEEMQREMDKLQVGVDAKLHDGVDRYLLHQYHHRLFLLSIKVQEV